MFSLFLVYFGSVFFCHFHMFYHDVVAFDGMGIYRSAVKWNSMNAASSVFFDLIVIEINTLPVQLI